VTREYSSISVETTLNSGINTTATTMVLPSVGAVTALLGGVTLDPGNVDIFTVAIDHDTVNEEIVFVTGVSGDTLTISRGQAGTGTAGVSGIAHNAGASVKHVLTSDDLIFFRNSASPVASIGFSGATSGTTTVQATAVAGTNTLTLPPTSNDTLVGRATTDTLTNKTLTAPVISTITNTGTITLPTSTDTLVGRATTDTLTNKTLTAPIITDAIIRGFEEDVNVVASAATGTINFDVSTASVWYYTSNATANHTLNFRYSSGATLSSVLAVGDAITLVWLNTNGSTAYYPNVIQIDGTTVTPKVPAAISAGNASSIDAYSFTIIKTAATPTYTVLETQTKFA
jgi:hypothetical protein